MPELDPDIQASSNNDNHDVGLDCRVKPGNDEKRKDAARPHAFTSTTTRPLISPFRIFTA